MNKLLALGPLLLGLAACQPYGNGSYGPYGQGPYGPGPYNQGPYGPGAYGSGPYGPGADDGGAYAPGQPQPYPGDAPGAMDGYRATGIDPGWMLDVTPDELRFSTTNGALRISQPRPQPISGVAGEVYRTPRLEVTIVHGRCGDGMSGRSYPDSVELYADGHRYRGCGSPPVAGYPTSNRPTSNGPTSNGLTNGVPAPMGTLANSNWRVTAINRRTMPPSNFYFNFMPDRIGAKFGCNNVSAPFTLSGDTLTAGPAVATQMACANGDFERQALAVLAHPMQINWGNPEHVSLSNQAGSIDLVKAR